MRNTRKADARFLGGCLLVLLLIGGGIVVLVNIVSPRMEVAAACGGQAVAASAPLREGSGPHRVEAVLLPAGRRTRYGCGEEEWWAESAGDTELVACVGPAEKYVIETCQYVRGPEITRYGYRREVTLVAAGTGEIIASEVFRGGSPRGCQQTEERSVTKLEGSRKLNTDVVCEWLSQYVVPGQAYRPARPTPRSQAVVRTPRPTVATPDPEPPAAILTPGSETPVEMTLNRGATYWNGPCLDGPCPNGWYLGRLDNGPELVEILATTDEWAEVRWMSPEKIEFMGWVQKRWLRTPAPGP